MTNNKRLSVDEEGIYRQPAATHTGADLRQFKVLIADDYPDNIRLLAARLKSEGYAYLTASDGVETLEKARSEQPDLVLLDVNMPL
ncbi:MAG TPA: response regulator [Anaerolineales bacterium]|nr:response regulator [Anaerolineales bacterium]